MIRLNKALIIVGGLTLAFGLLIYAQVIPLAIQPKQTLMILDEVLTGHNEWVYVDFNFEMPEYESAMLYAVAKPKKGSISSLRVAGDTLWIRDEGLADIEGQLEGSKTLDFPIGTYSGVLSVQLGYMAEVEVDLWIEYTQPSDGNGDDGDGENGNGMAQPSFLSYGLMIFGGLLLMGGFVKKK